MPEYPDIVIYIERLQHFCAGQRLQHIQIAHPFLLRTAEPPVNVLEAQILQGFERLGKRIVFIFSEDYFLILHLMINGRLRWYGDNQKVPAKGWLARLLFDNGSLIINETSSQKRASLHLVKGKEALRDYDRGGLEVMTATVEEFSAAIKAENHTLKRALTDPRILSGIGNAYSDEILHRARLSPTLLTQHLTGEQIAQLANATREVLGEWTERLRAEAGEGFLDKVIAFRKEMAVHGRYGQSCPVCGTAVQRIRYATNETNYCPRCQTGGKLLADRSLSQLLKKDWPRTIEELEERKH
ncbi:MAG: formamidopyrimidine-DNA glycosylase [Anaerolineae bacterium]|nr:formamidopyrimidine-DNA glycosylase [Anaerolineae bacterium]